MQNEGPWPASMQKNKKNHSRKSQHRAKTMRTIKMNWCKIKLFSLLPHCTSNWTFSLGMGKSSFREHWVSGLLLYSHQPRNLIYQPVPSTRLRNTLEQKEENQGDCIFLIARRYVNDLNANLMFYLSWFKWQNFKVYIK